MFQTLQPRDQVEGSGMGLSFVKKILSFYDSDITVESDLGKSAVFRFDWPKVAGQGGEEGERKEINYY